VTDEIRPRLYDYMGGIIREEIGKSLRLGGTDDHMHALMSMRTDVSVADALKKLKSLSSGWVHRTFPNGTTFAWQAGYGAFTVSRSRASAVTEYIDHQAEHHRRMTFQEELVRLLVRHGIEYDPGHVLD
jgi:hypothetical protein